MLRLFFLVMLCFAAEQSKAGLQGVELLGNRSVEVKPGKLGNVVIFLSAKCPCSNSHVPLVRNLQTDFPDFAFLAVHSNADESVSDARKYFAEAKLGMPILQDEKSRIADELKAYKTPHAFVLAPDGKVLYRGGITNSSNADSADRQFLRAALEDVAAGRTVKNPEARTLGCVISR